MKHAAFLLSAFLISGSFVAPACASGTSDRQTKDAQSLGLVVRAEVAASTDTIAEEQLIVLAVTLTNRGDVPIIFESCECAFSGHWISDQPLVTVATRADCAANDCADVQMLPGQEIARQITVRLASESPERTIQFRVGFCMWGPEGCTPYWSNPVSIERESSL